MGRGTRRPRSTRPGTFDPTDTTRVKHTRIGVWDLYEEINPSFAHVPGSSYAEKAFAAYECLPYCSSPASSQAPSSMKQAQSFSLNASIDFAQDAFGAAESRYFGAPPQIPEPMLAIVTICVRP